MREYIKLIRPYGMLFLGFTPFFTAVCNGQFDLFYLFPLVCIGVLVHIFTFVQNDLFDINVDRQSSYVSDRPLVSGNVSKKAAFSLVLISFLLSFFIAFVFFFSVISLGVLFVTFFFMTLYNKYSKSHAGMEYIIGLGVFSLGIFGALTVSVSISYLAIIIAVAGGLQWLFSVGVSANVKDVKYDAKQGINTTPSVFGVHVVNDKLVIPISFWGYALGIKIVHIVVVSLSFILGYTSIYLFGFPVPGVLFKLLSAILVFTTVKILSTPYSNREKMLRYQGLHEGLAILLIPVVLLSLLIENFTILPTFVLLVVLILWPLLCLRLLFGRKMIPLE